MHARPDISRTKHKPAGIASRTPTYPHWRQVADDFDGLATNRCQIQTAIAYGTADLSWPARSLLLLLVSHLSPSDIAHGKTTVWPGAAQIAAAFACSQRAVRAYKAELEAKGYLLRRYDCRNRPLRGAAFDLAPFLARLPEILATIEEAGASRRKQRLLQHAEREPRSASRAAETGHPINSQTPNSESVTVVACDKDSLAAVQDVMDASPRLRAVVSQGALNALVAGEPEQAIREVGHHIDHLLSGGAGRRNNCATWTWAVRRYGAKALAVLGIAIEDPCVHSPARFFGWLVTTAEPVDLTANLNRIRHRSPAPPAEPETKPEPEPAVLPELEQLLGQRSYQAWFNATRLVVDGSTAVLLAPTGFVADWIRNNFSSELRLFARGRGYSAIEVRADASLSAPPPSLDISALGNSALLWHTAAYSRTNERVARDRRTP